MKYFLSIYLTFAFSILLSAGQTVIHIVASDEDRPSAQTAISHILNPGSGGPVNAGWSFQGDSGDTSAAAPDNSSVILTSRFGVWNGSYNGNPLVIKVSYSGAMAAISAVAGQTPQRFVASDGTGSGQLANPMLSGDPADFETAVADFGFSSIFQNSSPFVGNYRSNFYNRITEEIVGVTPLGIYASAGFPKGVDNITTQQLTHLYKTGAIPLSLFTTDFDADHNKIVYAIGRNSEAGTRVEVLAENGLGQVVTELDPRAQGGSGVQGAVTSGGLTYCGLVAGHSLWPAETFSGIYNPVGSGGFGRGEELASMLTAALGQEAAKWPYIDDDGLPQYVYPDATGGFYIGYLTAGQGYDRVLGWNEVVPPASRGMLLKYNGVELTEDNIRHGPYPLWLYNRIIKPQEGLTGIKLNFANSLRDQIRYFDAVAAGGILYDSRFLVARYADGGVVTIDDGKFIDSDVDGLPDAFEWDLISSNPNDAVTNLSQVAPDGDFDGDGIKNLDESRFELSGLSDEPSDTASHIKYTYDFEVLTGANLQRGSLLSWSYDKNLNPETISE